MGQSYSNIIYEDIHFQNRPYDRWKAYGQSKIANILFSYELSKRGKKYGINSFSLHPGSIVGIGLENILQETNYMKRVLLMKMGMLFII